MSPADQLDRIARRLREMALEETDLLVATELRYIVDDIRALERQLRREESDA